MLAHSELRKPYQIIVTQNSIGEDYSYLDDKYKNQNQAQRRKGKKESNPDPKTGSEYPPEQTITVGNNGQQTTYDEHDTREFKEPVDTPAEYVTSNQQSNLANIQKSDLNPDPDPKTETESLSLGEQGTIQLEEANIRGLHVESSVTGNQPLTI
jgi:hypothetical protein